MSDKKLLEESTVRRFQALANIKPVGGLISEGKKSGGKKSETPAGGRKVSSAMSPKDSEERAAGKVHEGYEEEGWMHEAEEGEAAGADMGAGVGDMGAMGGGEEAGGGGSGGDWQDQPR